MAGNPRLDDLRKRLEKEPGSRLFAQLAEELRKEGELEEAIQVAREGLKKHPNYPSARMTLGRALLDTGDLAAAKAEFEVVLKGAPDNILASRYLAQCLEGMGDLEGATGRYKLTLQLAPGDKHAATRLHAVEEQLRATGSFKPLPSTLAGAARTGAAAAAPGAAPAPAAPPSAPGATATAAPAPTAGAAATAEPPAAEAEPEAAPIKLVAAEEEFELERPYEANAAPPASVPVRTAAPAEATAPEPAPSAAPATPGEFEFDLGSTPTIPFQVTPVDEGGEPPEMAEATAPEPPPAAPEPPAAAAPEPPAAPAAAPPAAEAGVGAELVSSTLAELYFKQGHIDKACEVYGQLLEREPANEHVRQRFAELSDLAQRAAAPPATSVAPAPPPTPTPAGDDRAARRQALERTIARLEGFLSAVKRSAP